MMTTSTAATNSIIIKVTCSLLVTFAMVALAVKGQQPMQRFDEMLLRHEQDPAFQQLYQSSASNGHPGLSHRLRRQVSYPTLPQPLPQSPPPQSPPPSSGSNVFGFLSNLGPQVEQAQSSVKMFSSLFGGNSQQPGSALGQPGQSAGAGGPSASQILSQLTELVRSTQTRSANQLNSAAQDGIQQGQLQATNAAQSAQTGMQAALTEVVQGLQRIAMSNPSLLPEVKNLYQRVSTRLSSAGQQVSPNNAFSGPIQPAKNSEQLADNLAKVALGQTQA